MKSILLLLLLVVIITILSLPSTYGAPSKSKHRADNSTTTKKPGSSPNHPTGSSKPKNTEKSSVNRGTNPKQAVITSGKSGSIRNARMISQGSSKTTKKTTKPPTTSKRITTTKRRKPTTTPANRVKRLSPWEWE